MSTQTERRKYKVVFCVLDCATGKTVSGEQPLKGEDTYQVMVAFPPAGFELVPEEHHESWLGDICSAAAMTVGKKVTSILKSLALPAKES